MYIMYIVYKIHPSIVYNVQYRQVQFPGFTLSFLYTLPPTAVLQIIAVCPEDKFTARTFHLVNWYFFFATEFSFNWVMKLKIALLRISFNRQTINMAVHYLKLIWR